MKKIIIPIAAVLVLSAGFFHFKKENQIHERNIASIEKVKIQSMQQSLKSLHIDDAKIGKGREATDGDQVKIHYSMHLEHDFKVIDSNLGAAPMTIKLGAHEAVLGLELGILGMKKGGLRTLTVPAHYAYGDKGAGNGLIPPNATLVYEIQLLEN